MMSLLGNLNKTKTTLSDPVNLYILNYAKISHEKYQYYWTYNPQDYLNPLLIPKKVSATKFELIDLDAPP
jgi:hypothetical protein